MTDSSTSPKRPGSGRRHCWDGTVRHAACTRDLTGSGRPSLATLSTGSLFVAASAHLLLNPHLDVAVAVEDAAAEAAPVPGVATGARRSPAASVMVSSSGSGLVAWSGMVGSGCLVGGLRDRR